MGLISDEHLDNKPKPEHHAPLPGEYGRTIILPGSLYVFTPSRGSQCLQRAVELQMLNIAVMLHKLQMPAKLDFLADNFASAMEAAKIVDNHGSDYSIKHIGLSQ